jgi:hypothetical protein
MIAFFRESIYASSLLFQASGASGGRYDVDHHRVAQSTKDATIYCSRAYKIGLPLKNAESVMQVSLVFVIVFAIFVRIGVVLILLCLYCRFLSRSSGSSSYY